MAGTRNPSPHRGTRSGAGTEYPRPEKLARSPAEVSMATSHGSIGIQRLLLTHPLSIPANHHRPRYQLAADPTVFGAFVSKTDSFVSIPSGRLGQQPAPLFRSGQGQGFTWRDRVVLLPSVTARVYRG